MHLTLDSLHNMKKTCSEIQGFEGLMNAEDRMLISEQVVALRGAVDSALETVTALEHVRGSLEACGYSEEWFDNVSRMGLKDLVQLDMPKFFDNKANRQQVCMEGLVDSIKEWLKKAWEMLKKFLGWIRDALAKLVAYLHAESFKNQGIIQKAFTKIDAGIDKYLQTKQGIDLNGWYDVEGLVQQVPAIRTLIEICTDSYFVQNGVTTADYNKDEVSGDMKKDFIQKINHELYQKGIPSDKPEQTGFIVKNDPNTNSAVQFLGVQIRKDFPKTKLEIRSKATMDGIKDLLMNKLIPMINETMNYLKASDVIMKNMIGTTQQEIAKLETGVDVNPGVINYHKKVVIQANLASQVVGSALMFMNKFLPMVSVDRDLIVKVASVMIV